MTYNMIARIIMSEHPNEKDLEQTSDHKEAVKDGFLANTQFSFGANKPHVIVGHFKEFINPLQIQSSSTVKSGLMKRRGKYIDTFYRNMRVRLKQ